MRFELTRQIIDEILFFMEDQHGDFYLDAEEGGVASFDDIDFDDEEDRNDTRFFSLPEWESSDGFRLMESFTAGLRNPLVRDKLSAALNRGRGVFRAFKDTLAEYPEVEKLWYSYKDREMKHEVIQWYNALRESWGLELIGEEPDDIEDIAREDFRFREGAAADSEAAQQLHRYCIANAESPAELTPWIFPGDMCVVAESAGGEFAAYMCASTTTDGACHVAALEVKPEYRGLGLGKALLDRLLEQADSGNISRVSIDLPAEFENFARVLSRAVFYPAVTRYCRET